MQCSNRSLFDHLIGGREQLVGNRQAESKLPNGADDPG
jgi:hypothetical protein